MWPAGDHTWFRSHIFSLNILFQCFAWFCHLQPHTNCVLCDYWIYSSSAHTFPLQIYDSSLPHVRHSGSLPGWVNNRLVIIKYLFLNDSCATVDWLLCWIGNVCVFSFHQKNWLAVLPCSQSRFWMTSVFSFNVNYSCSVHHTYSPGFPFTVHVFNNVLSGMTSTLTHDRCMLIQKLFPIFRALNLSALDCMPTELQTTFISSIAVIPSWTSLGD